jgi:replicative DNA helicase
VRDERKDDLRNEADRLPPQNLEAERGVLGAIMLDNNVFDDVIDHIKGPDDFYRKAHEVVYEQMLWMRENGRAIDAVTLPDRLTQLGEYERIGGDELLAEISNSVPHAANAAYHADIVRQKSVSRQLIQMATDIIKDGYSNAYASDELLDNAEKRVFSIRDKQVSRGTVGIMQAVDEALLMMDKVKNSGEVNWLLTGIPPLDKILMGLHGGQLIIMAGRPGAGKSAFAAQVCAHIAGGQHESTLLISLEMLNVEFARRMIAAGAGINSKVMKSPKKLSDAQAEKINEAAGKVAITRLRIDDTPGQSLMQIAANARRWKRKDNLGLLVVDYLQKIKEPMQKGEGRHTVVGRISTGLKNLAKELNIPIIALAQLNRDMEKDKRAPQMSDIRESGDIEADADVILLLHNRTPKGQEVGPVDIIVAKNRDGEEGIVGTIFDRPTSTFTAIAASGQQEAASHNPILDSGFDDNGEFAFL